MCRPCTDTGGRKLGLCCQGYCVYMGSIRWKSGDRHAKCGKRVCLTMNMGTGLQIPCEIKVQRGRALLEATAQRGGRTSEPGRALRARVSLHLPGRWWKKRRVPMEREPAPRGNVPHGRVRWGVGLGPGLCPLLSSHSPLKRCELTLLALLVPGHPRLGSPVA